jgi:hypothetical protein
MGAVVGLVVPEWVVWLWVRGAVGVLQMLP